MECRINSLLKKHEIWKQCHLTPQIDDDQILSFNEICLDPKNHVITVSGRVIHTTPTQFRLLQAFMSYPDRLLTRSWLKETVWSHLKISSRSIDAHISKLKRLFPILDTYLISIYGKAIDSPKEKKRKPPNPNFS